VQNLRWGIEQLTLSALRNVIGMLDLDHTLSSRDTINTQIRAALDERDGLITEPSPLPGVAAE
jgi:regulator of protease activity HflC (stomatin/prohibitin superfamily)